MTAPGLMTEARRQAQSAANRYGVACHIIELEPGRGIAVRASEPLVGVLYSGKADDGEILETVQPERRAPEHLSPLDCCGCRVRLGWYNEAEGPAAETFCQPCGAGEEE